ncbi:hypothetical protein Tco_1368512 [Tanacetum coccineum]
MACSLPHTVDEIHALVQKLIHKDSVRQKAMMDLAVQFDNASAAKHDLRKSYEKCNDIPQETRTLIDTFLKQESDKDYEMNLAIYRKEAKIEKQIETKYVCNPPAPEEPIEAIPQQPYTTPTTTQKPIGVDEEVLRETLEEQARAKKMLEERIKKEQAEYELFTLEFGVQSDSEYESN